MVKEGADGLERWRSPKTGRWYPVANRPNGVTGPRLPTVKAATRFKIAGWVGFGLGAGISIYQGVDAYFSEEKDREKKMVKAGVDLAMGIVGLLGPVGFAIATVYFIVDTAISLGTDGGSTILDLPELLGPRSSGYVRMHTPRELRLLIPADNTRVYTPSRVAPPPRTTLLRQSPVASHNAVFRPAYDR